MRLLIAIPVFNEEKYVQDVLNRVRRFHPDILVVDDGSTDATAEILRRRSGIHRIHHPENRGYGQSLIDAFKWADARGYDWVTTMDCDEQHEPEMIPRFIQECRTDRWDVISGSRYLRASKENDLPPSDRRAINRTITDTVNDLFGWQLTDAFCGFKAHRVSAMRKLTLDEPGYAFPLQFWPQCYAHALRIHEIPIRLIYKDPTRHFGGMLDDAQQRLNYYRHVLQRELKRLAPCSALAPRPSPLAPC